MATITGTTGNDTLIGTAAGDVIRGLDGDDTLSGGAGRDTIYGGDGNDTYRDLDPNGGSDLVLLEGGDDRAVLDYLTLGQPQTVDGGSGQDTFDFGAFPNTVINVTLNDAGTLAFGGTLVAENVYLNFENVTGNAQAGTITGNASANTLDGAGGDDRLFGGGGADSIIGGQGRDTIDGGDSADRIDGGDDDDSIQGGLGPDTLLGGRGQDVIRGGADADSLDGGDGDDALSGDAGDDRIDGGLGQDRLYGGDGADELHAGDTASNRSIDSLYGGAGDDRLFSNGNQDTLLGEGGSDRLTLVADGQLFNALTAAGGEDANGLDVDVLDLSPLKALYPGLTVTYEQGGPGLEDGRILLRATPSGPDLGRVTYTGIETIVICFTPGTMIATQAGEVPVESLRPGDRVMTRDNGLQEVAWTGRRDLSALELAASPALRPVRVRAGSIAPGVPDRDLLVSPQHRLLFVGPSAQLHFGDTEVLVAARHMAGRDGFRQVDARGVSYIHVMFERHQVVLSNGAWTESFQPGDWNLRGLGDAQRDEILGLFPELGSAGAIESYRAARKTLRRREALLLGR